VEQQQCEKCALLAATKRQTTTAVVMNLERPENAEVHWPPDPIDPNVAPGIPVS
jgi:hypothetical protein